MGAVEDWTVSDKPSIGTNAVYEPSGKFAPAIKLPITAPASNAPALKSVDAPLYTISASVPPNGKRPNFIMVNSNFVSAGQEHFRVVSLTFVKVNLVPLVDASAWQQLKSDPDPVVQVAEKAILFGDSKIIKTSKI